MKFFKLLAFSLLLLLFCLGPLSVQAEITAQARLGNHSFPVDRVAKLTVLVNGAGSSKIEIPEVPGIRFHSRGQSSQINIVNGSYSSSVSNIYLVQASSPGKYTIPPIIVVADKESVQTEPIHFEVTGAGQTTSQNSGQKNGEKDNRVAFIRTSETGKHYSGEIVPVTIKAYFNPQYRTNINSLPVLKGDGVVMAPLSNEPEQTEELFEGKKYNALTWTTSFSGIKAGNHPIQLEFDATVLVTKRRRATSPFAGNSLFDDSFFNSVFGGAQQKPIKVVSEDLHFEVSDLPSQGKPENFTGAIGEFQLKVKASPTTIDVGEPITLSIVIEGKGNFDRAEAPVFPITTDWKAYSPTSDYSKPKNLPVGSKLFEQAIVAKVSDLKEIPPLTFSYFDPTKNSYQTISSAPIPVTISGPAPVDSQPNLVATTSSPTPKPIQPEREAPPIADLAPIHLETGTFVKEIIPLYKKRWFILACCLSVAILIFSSVAKGRRKNLEKHPELRLLKKRKQVLAEDLELLAKAKSESNSAHFLSICRQTVQHQLGLQWDIEPTAISLADIEKRLTTHPQLIEIFAAAEHAAYGGTHLSFETMQNYLETVQRDLEELL